MTFSRPNLIFLATAGSAALLIGALGFQYLGQMPPCKLCYWQRYPHVVAVLIGLTALMLPGRLWPLLGASAALTSAAIGIYHTGVERKLWEGPTSCTSSSPAGLSAQDLFDKINAAPVVRCDEVPWEMFGLSMASWNAVVSIALALLWLSAARSRV